MTTLSSTAAESWTLRFDRRDPIGKATYETTASVQSRQVICDERQRGCARPRVENTTVARPVSGKLHLKRIDEPRDRANARG
jgi:hypothetical protein